MLNFFSSRVRVGRRLLQLGVSISSTSWLYRSICLFCLSASLVDDQVDQPLCGDLSRDWREAFPLSKSYQIDKFEARGVIVGIKSAHRTEAKLNFRFSSFDVVETPTHFDYVYNEIINQHATVFIPVVSIFLVFIRKMLHCNHLWNCPPALYQNMAAIIEEYCN